MYPYVNLSIRNDGGICFLYNHILLTKEDAFLYGSFFRCPPFDIVVRTYSKSQNWGLLLLP